MSTATDPAVRAAGMRCAVARDVADELEALADVYHRDSDRALLYAIADVIRRVNFRTQARAVAGEERKR